MARSQPPPAWWVLQPSAPPREGIRGGALYEVLDPLEVLGMTSRGSWAGPAGQAKGPKRDPVGANWDRLGVSRCSLGVREHSGESGGVI